ncbi:MAG: glutamine amidotransferase-related protein, partial [Chitinophagaceae bacterium]
EISDADKIFLPGVGSFGTAIKIIKQKKIDIAIKNSLKKNSHILGICLGMQMAAIEFARNVLGLKGANSTEMNLDTEHPVIDLMDEQKKVTSKGGTMRLGAYPCVIEKDSLAYQIYGKEEISERHRHRWEFNNRYLSDFESAGMAASGKNPDTGLVEIIELKNHPFFIGVQYHPELKSTVEEPQPIFVQFIKAALQQAELVLSKSTQPLQHS